MVLSSTLHLVTEGYYMEPRVLRSNQLAIASEYHVLFVPAPVVPRLAPRRLEVFSPAVVKRGETDRSER